MSKKNLQFILLFLFFISFTKLFAAGEEPVKIDWSFKGITGKFDRSSLQRGIKFTTKFVLHVIQ